MTVSVETAVRPPLAGFRASDVFTDVPPFAVGTCVETNLGNTYRFVRSAKALKQGSVYRIDDGFNVGNDVSAMGDSAKVPFALGVPQQDVAAPTGLYTWCWVQTGGQFAYLKLCAGTGPTDVLYLSSAPGALTSIYSSVGSTGVQAVRSMSTAAVVGAAGVSTLQSAFSPCELIVPREYQ